MLRSTGLILTAFTWVSGAFAAPVHFNVTDAAGAPLANAVIMVETDEDVSSPVSFDWPNAMSQQDRQFAPYVLIVPKGSEVEFPNRDRFRHHVYSFSRGNRFELKLYGREEARYVTFDRAGVVAIGCNIHDDMIGFIRVVDTPHAIKTDHEGKATLDLPSRTMTVTAWHPMTRAKDNTSSIDIVSGETYALQLDVPGQPGRAPNHTSGHSAGHH